MTKNTGVFDKSAHCLKRASAVTPAWFQLGHIRFMRSKHHNFTLVAEHIFGQLDILTSWFYLKWFGRNAKSFLKILNDVALIPKLGKNPNSSLCEAFCLHRLCVGTSYIWRCVYAFVQPCMDACLCVWTPPYPLFLSVASHVKCSGRVATTWATSAQLVLSTAIWSVHPFICCFDRFEDPCWLELNAAPPPARISTASCDA